MEGDKYGYEIRNLILERTGGVWELKESTMFSSLKRLEDEGAVDSYWGDDVTATLNWLKADGIA